MSFCTSIVPYKNGPVGQKLKRISLIVGALGAVMSPAAFAAYCTDAPISGEQYKLVNEGSGLNAEVVSKSKDDNAKLIQRFSRSKLNSQKFTLAEVSAGIWKISALHSDKYLTSADDLVQATDTNSDNQYWSFSPTGSGAFTISSLASNEVIGAESGEISAFISAASETGSAYQGWFLSPVSATCENLIIRLDGGAGNGEVALSWDKVVGDVEALEIYSSTSPNSKDRQPLAVLDAGARTYTARNVQNDVEHWFWVKYKVAGVWLYSNGFNATPKSKGAMLSQLTNPVKSELETYKDKLLTGTLAADKVLADNMISWQLPTGGFYKHKEKVYQKPWDGTSKRSGWSTKIQNADGSITEVPLGTIDNDATVRELMFLADTYQRSGDTKYRDATRKAFDFLVTMQYKKGGWPQVYPERSGTLYSNHVTFNDNAMIRVMYMMDRVEDRNWPFNGDVLTGMQRSAAARTSKKGVKYIRRSQIKLDGKRTIWSAQHDPDDYTPLGARSYELAGRNGKASALIVSYLMSIPQTQDIMDVVEGGLGFYRDTATQKADAKYVKRSKSSVDDTYNPIQIAAGKTMWYRFYELDSSEPFFSGRAATDKTPGLGKQFDIMDIEPERRYGYEWAGSYGSKLLKFANGVGY